MSEKYKSEYRPTWKNINKYPAPNGTKVLLRTRYGTAIIGQYYPEGEFTHWCGLPKLSAEDKEELHETPEKSESKQRDWTLEHSEHWR